MLLGRNKKKERVSVPLLFLFWPVRHGSLSKESSFQPGVLSSLQIHELCKDIGLTLASNLLAFGAIAAAPRLRFVATNNTKAQERSQDERNHITHISISRRSPGCHTPQTMLGIFGNLGHV